MNEYGSERCPAGDLADDAGHDRILAEAERRGVQLNGILGDEMSQGEFAGVVELDANADVELEAWREFTLAW